MRIVVVGAGVGGISVARGLLRDGHDVTVAERRPHLAAGGGAVTIWPNGAAVLAQLGVDLDGAGQQLSTLRVVTSAGRRISTIDLAAVADRLGAPVRMIPRRVLLERLLAGFPADRIRTGRGVAAARPTAAGAVVQFDDGTCVGADLVIGADGLHSTVRSAIGAAPASATGWCSWQGLSTVSAIAEERTATIVVGAGASLGLWPAGGREMQWWFDLPWSTDFVKPARPIEMIRATFTGWSSAADEVLAGLTDDDLAPSPFPHHRHPIPRTPGAGPLTLLGDAAHTMPPLLAQGANQALLDAMVLCRALESVRRGDDPSEALRRYEHTRRRRVAAVSRVAAVRVSRPESMLRPAAVLPDRVATWALTTFLRSVSHRRAALRINLDLTAGAGGSPRECA